MTVYKDEDGLIWTEKPQPASKESCSKVDVVKRGTHVLERYIAAKIEFNEWVEWVIEVAEVEPISYIPPKLTGTYAETLLAALEQWLENNQ